MRIKEAIKTLDELEHRVGEDSVAESAHCAADEILVLVIEEHLSRELAEAYRQARERIGFWYA